MHAISDPKLGAGGTLQLTTRLMKRCVPGEGARITLGLFLLLVASGMTALQPLPLKLVIDSLIGDMPLPASFVTVSEAITAYLPYTGNSKFAQLLLLCLSILALQLLVGALSVLHSYVLTSIGLRMVFKLRCALFDHIQRMSLAFHDRTTIGDSLYRVTWDTYAIQTLFNRGIVTALASLFTLVVITVVMLSIDPYITLVALFIGLPLVLVVKHLERPMTERSLCLSERESAVSTRVQEALSGIRAVKAFGGEELEVKRFRLQADASLRANLTLTVLETGYQSIIGFLLAAATAAVVWMSVKQVVNGSLTAGDVVLLVAYVGILYKPLETLAHTAAVVQAASAGARRVLEILETSPDISDRAGAQNLPGRAAGHVCFEGVSFTYSDRPTLNNINLEIAAGTTVALVGQSGAGKTTLASLLLRFYDPTEGRITLDGNDLRDLTLESLRRNISIVTQEPVLFHASISENIAYGSPGATLEQIEESARNAGAHEFIEHLPEGYDTIIGERGVTLSGGERQRLSIARAFLKDAPVLVLDEPTSALDINTEERLLKTLESLMRGRTTLIVAHRFSTLRNAELVVMLKNGCIVEMGLQTDLLARESLYACLFTARFSAHADVLRGI